MRIRTQRRVYLAAGALAAAVVAAGGLLSWKEVRLRWATERAREALLAAPSLISNPPLGWEELLASQEAAYPILIRLLRDTDPVVWTRALEAIDMWHEGARKPDWEDLSPFQAHLRDSDDVAWLKYQLPNAYQHSTEWRRAGQLLAPDYWSGRHDQPLAATPAVLDFLEELLAGVGQSAFQAREGFLWPDERIGFELRALLALRAMLHRQGTVSSEPVELLRWAAAKHRFPPLRLAALSALCRTQDPFAEAEPCVLRDTWWFDPPSAAAAYLAEQKADVGSDADSAELHLPHALELIAHLDSSWALFALAEASRLPELSEDVALALGSERGRWPVLKPVWLPLEQAAQRYLARESLDERAAAVLALVALGTPAAREVLNAHEPEETHAELKLLVRTGLAALGDTRFVAEGERVLGVRLAGLLSMPGNDGRWHWPWSYEDPGKGWAEPLRIRLDYLIRHMLSAGSRKALDQVIVACLQGRLGPGSLNLAAHIDGLPPELQAEVREERFQLIFDDDKDLQALEAWWRARGSELRWDASRKRFTAER